MDELNGERSMESRYTMVLKYIAKANLPYDSENSNWGSATKLRGGREVQERGDTCTLKANSC